MALAFSFCFPVGKLVFCHKPQFFVEEVLQKYQKLLKIKENEQEKLENESLSETNKKFGTAQLEKNLKNSKILEKNKQLKELEKKTGVCPSCKRPYSEDNCGIDDRISEIKDEIERLNKEFNDCGEYEDACLDELNKIKQKITKIKSEITLVTKEINRLVNLENKIKILQTKNQEISIYMQNVESDMSCVRSYM